MLRRNAKPRRRSDEIGDALLGVIVLLKGALTLVKQIEVLPPGGVSTRKPSTRVSELALAESLDPGVGLRSDRP